jgi:membrane protein implicated in regulation of membrane protease activity
VTIELWMMAAGALTCLLVEAGRRKWIGLAAWAAGLASVVVRLAPITPPVSQPASFAFAAVFVVLVVVRVVQGNRGSGRQRSGEPAATRPDSQNW